MKQRYVIDGKVYDLRSAELVWRYRSDSSSGDFDHYDAALYRAKSGAFFVAGHGGARSPFARDIGKGWTSSGSGAFTLTSEEALEWLQQHGADAGTILGYFDLPVA